MRPSLLFLFALLLAAPAARADTCAWTGGSTGDWTGNANWSCNHAPGAGDAALIGDFVTVTLNADVSVTGFSLGGGTLTGSGALTVTGTLSWTHGTMGGTGTTRVPAGGTLTLAGTGTRTLNGQRQFINEGTGTWGGTGMFSNSNEGSAFLNRGTLTLSAAPPSNNPAFFAGRFVNEAGATLRKEGAVTSAFSSLFDNDGTVEVAAGALALTGFNGPGGTDSGDYVVSAGAVLVFGDTRTVAASGSVTGDGTLRPTAQTVFNGTLAVPTLDMGTNNNPTFTLNTDASVTQFSLAQGALSGSGTLTVTGGMTWTGGTMNGTGTTRIPPGATLTLSGDVTRSLQAQRQLVNEGAATWTGAGSFSNGNEGSAFVNRGTLALDAVRGDANALYFAGRLINETGATITRSVGGTIPFTALFENAGTVTINAGTLALGGFNGPSGTSTGLFQVGAGAGLAFTSGHTLSPGAVVTGPGTVTQPAAITHNGTVRPGTGPGTLPWNATGAAYAPSSTAALDVELGGTGAGQSDVLAVTGDATLGGTLRVRRTGGFQPAVGQRFAVVTCTGTCSGSFAALDLPPGLTGRVDVSAGMAEFVVESYVAGEAGPESAVTALHAPAPNPAVGRAALRYSLATAGPARLSIYDALGREVAVLTDADTPAGSHEATLDATRLAPGLYVARLTTPEGALTQRVTVVH